MKRRVLALILAAATAVSMIGCGGSGLGSAGEGMIEKVDLLEIEGFNEAYAPDISSVAQQEGQIDVVIMFDGTETGWEALAKEYERLQGGYVTVKLDTTYIDTVSYTEKLRSEVQGDTEWDIVQGNLIGGELMETYCINMASWITEGNAYAGAGNTWKSVLTENAYITDTSGSNSDCYILNTENLQTAWFINSVALKAAADKGYVNAEGKAENPITWDDMMLLCKKMVEEGPSSKRSWILRSPI